MPTKVVSITLNAAPLDQLIGEIPERAETILDKIAFDIERTAKPLTAYDTGAMRNSIYVSGASGNSGTDYSEATSEARARRPRAMIIDEVKSNGRFERVVGASVNYAYWQELVKPFLTPAVEQQRPKAQQAWRELFR